MVEKRRLSTSASTASAASATSKRAKARHAASSTPAKAAYTTSQRAAISNFIGITQVDKANAARALKSHGWNVDLAINAYYANGNSNAQVNPHRGTLSQLFDLYRDDPKGSPDSVGMNGMMNYLKDLNVAVEDVGMLIISELVGSTTLGEMNRDGFIKGWSEHSATTIQAQKITASKLRQSIASPASRPLLKRVYLNTFFVARTPGQKSIALEVATEYWRVLFSAPSADWSSPTSPWLDWWLEFLNGRFKRSINRDIWDQTFALFEKSMNDEGLSWWDENGAWPSVIDDFVTYVRDEKRAGQTTTQNNDDVDMSGL